MTILDTSWLIALPLYRLLEKPNKAKCLDGRFALNTMLNGSLMDLASVRQYLDANAPENRW
jgi:hypothetical protein